MLWTLRNPMVTSVFFKNALKSSRAVIKNDPMEKVGNFCFVDGKMTVIEYSDLPAELRDRRDGEGRLEFRAGNIAAHAFRRDFLERVGGGDAQDFVALVEQALAVGDHGLGGVAADVAPLGSESPSAELAPHDFTLDYGHGGSHSGVQALATYGAFSAPLSFDVFAPAGVSLRLVS